MRDKGMFRNALVFLYEACTKRAGSVKLYLLSGTEIKCFTTFEREPDIMDYE
jgi:hypothetical protein